MTNPQSRNELAYSHGYEPGPFEGVPEGTFETFPDTGPLHAYLWWATKTTDAPAWFHIGSILTSMACEIARRGWTIDPSRGLVPNLWIAMVAAPGIGKSTAINTARDFYTDFSMSLKAPDPYITADGSVQGLFEAIAQRHNADTNVTAAILTREEFSTLLSNRRRDDLATSLCEWADGRHHERHTRQLQKAAAAGPGGPGAGHARIENPAISATFVTTQQALLDVATLAHMHGGLFSRFDWLFGRGEDVTPMMHPTRRPQERAVALEHWKIWHDWELSEGLVPESKPKVVELGPDVEAYLRERIFADYERLLKEEDPLTANYKRAITHAYIIAGIYALSQQRRVISEHDMHRAVNLLNICLDNIARLAPEVAVTPLMRAMNRGFDFIRRGGADGVSRSALYRFLQVSKKELDAVVDTLVDEGSVKPAVTIKTNKPGRPPTRYVAVGDRRYASGTGNNVEALQSPAEEPEETSDEDNVVPIRSRVDTDEGSE